MSTTEPSASHELLGDIQALATEAAAIFGQAASGKPTAEGIATLRAQFEVAQAHFAELYGEARQKALRTAKAADLAVHENPYPTIAVIAGISLLAGVFIGRSLRK